MDENRAFWRTVLLSERKLEEVQSVVDQLNEKSGSTLEEISFEVKGDSSQDFSQLVESIFKSRQVLQVLHMGLDYAALQGSRALTALTTLTTLTISLLLKLPNLVDLRASPSASKVRLLRASAIKFGSLQIL